RCTPSERWSSRGCAARQRHDPAPRSPCLPGTRQARRAHPSLEAEASALRPAPRARTSAALLAEVRATVLGAANELLHALGRVPFEDQLATQVDDLVAQERGALVLLEPRGLLHLRLELLDQAGDLVARELRG